MFNPTDNDPGADRAGGYALNENARPLWGRGRAQGERPGTVAVIPHLTPCWIGSAWAGTDARLGEG